MRFGKAVGVALVAEDLTPAWTWIGWVKGIHPIPPWIGSHVG